jgi:hypothetical protein
VSLEALVPRSCRVRNLLAEAHLAIKPMMDGRILSCSCQTVVHEHRAPVGIETRVRLRARRAP